MSKRSVRRGAEQRAVKEQRRAHRRTVGLALGAGAAAAGMSLVPVSAAQAAAFSVTTDADMGAGSLRQAVEDANAAPGPDTITFDPSVTDIPLSSSIEITQSVTIAGPGAGALTIDGGGNDRIFVIHDDSDDADQATVISGLTLTGGFAEPEIFDQGNGGAIYSKYSSGDLTLQGVAAKGNRSADGSGGALSDFGLGDLIVTDSTFTDNTAYYDGGAFNLSGNASVTITGSTFTGNESENTNGGAVYNGSAGATVITGSTFTDNEADVFGGAINQRGGPDAGPFTMTSTELSDNTSQSGAGISLQDASQRKLSQRPSQPRAAGDPASVRIDSSDIHDNTASDSGQGGGVYVEMTGAFELTDSVVSGNSSGSGAGAYVYQASSATISGTTVDSNTAVGRAGGLLLGGDGQTGFPVDVVNSTISGNEAIEGNGDGGGVYAYETNTVSGGQITFTHTTIANNRGSGLTSEDGDVTLRGSIVADNTAADLVKGDSQEKFALDYSLVEKQPAANTTMDVTAGSNLIGVDPQLGALADNGGPTQTQTQVPGAGSPVLDAAKAFGTTKDQRGLARPSNLSTVTDAAGGDASDMGAVEVQAPTPTPPVTTPPVTTPGVPAGTSASCDGVVATIVAKPGVATVGTPGRDVIVGTAGADVITGGGGNDLICGLGGDDKVDAGAGADTVFGGDGNDLIKGGTERDVLKGDGGNDKILGGRANDTIDGGAGNDQIRGNRGNDRLKGGGGKDYIRGGKNRDRITGGGGKDKVRGGVAKDTITKEKGENQLQ